MKKRVIVAMSGGVDSSVAAYILSKCGYEIVGLFMRMGNFEDETVETKNTGCCSFDDSCDARAVAETIGFPFYVLNFEQDFEKIVDYFCSEYTAGNTPNPCIKCNQNLKFGKLFDFAKALDAEFIATGHYSRIDKQDGRYILKRGIDLTKDQSYVLAQLNQKQLSKTIFPLGNLTKNDVRLIAEQLNLKTKNKPESQEICFIPDNNYKRFVTNRIKGKIKPGFIKDLEGNILGEHRGIQYYTIGQRRGLKIALGKPMYVVNIDTKNDDIIIGNYEALFKKELFARELNWVLIKSLDKPLNVFTKIRYSHKPFESVLHPAGDHVVVKFKEPQAAVTPGQAVVFYDYNDMDIVVGAGWITKGV